MADVLSVGVNLEAFAQAISAIQALRSSVSRVFDCLKDGMRNKETLEGREKAFIAHFQDNLHSVNRDLNELERLSNLVGKPSENHPLHNSGLLSLDPVQDKTPLYSQLLQAYKWSNKLQYHAGLASGLLNQQSLKRSANQMGVSAKRRPKAQPTTLVLPPQYVDDVISRIDRMFPEMSIHLSRPNGTSAMLLLDIWSKSNYQVFQKVTDHATTALLHYQLPQMPDVVVRSFMMSPCWMRTVNSLLLPQACKEAHGGIDPSLAKEESTEPAIKIPPHQQEREINDNTRDILPLSHALCSPEGPGKQGKNQREGENGPLKSTGLLT
ncbi:mediator of RNA polymerase II transcription subunit 27 isoform X2 [Felis catus]|uniref:mediator of RNA polymerase II transcription subunit 27 isoform X2 n=1 Tax=Felis catus TaxID=9685 RepID=UPI001D1A05C4|nr:mediator of RNA polymerase II transcription subunit 27 isoform X2 [Felis catus]